MPVYEVLLVLLQWQKKSDPNYIQPGMLFDMKVPDYLLPKPKFDPMQEEACHRNFGPYMCHACAGHQASHARRADGAHSGQPLL